MIPLRAIPLLLLFASAASADSAEAEILLREGDAAGAIAAVQGEESDAAHFWHGRALIAKGCLKEAAEHLQRVREQSPLYPYAAKALLYCAWQDPEVDFAAVATPLTISKNNDLATLSTSALAEYRLAEGITEGNAALDLLRNMAVTRQELNPLLHLLEIQELRHRGDLQEAAQRCRLLEQERDLPTALRHRARLELAEIYYEKEYRDEEPENAEKEGEEDVLRVTNAHGTGEETLLHFISSYAESPLLHEAFRRLAVHHAFEESEYARLQLQEWGNDTRYPHRAAIALYIRQHLLNNAAGADKPLDVTCANAAAANFPQEPVTEAILLEQARWMLERGELKDAGLYLQMVQKETPLKRFLSTRLLPQDEEETAEAYLACAAQAAPALRRAALSNALLCALRAGNDELADRVMEAAPADADALMEVTIGFHLEHGETAPAAMELQALAELTDNVTADIALDRVLLALENGDTRAAGSALAALPPAAVEQKRRLFALQESYCLHSGATEDETLKVLKETAEGDDTLIPVLADRYLAGNRPKEALELLATLLNRADIPEALLPDTLYRAARASERLGTKDALLQAAEYYEHCAAAEPAMAVRATIRRAAVLSRIGRVDEALQLLPGRDETSAYSTEDRLLCSLVRSTALMLRGSADDRQAAEQETGYLLNERQGFNREQLSLLLLHHGAIASRLGLAEAALQDYREIISLKSPTPDSQEWDTLYIAAAGAITKCEQTGRFEEAASIADTAAEWNPGGDAERSARFREWAGYLRQTHFLKQPEQR